ncbi:hypothetical protein Tco_0673863 [Tanacetum coccineum]
MQIMDDPHEDMVMHFMHVSILRASKRALSSKLMLVYPGSHGSQEYGELLINESSNTISLISFMKVDSMEDGNIMSNFWNFTSDEAVKIGVMVLSWLLISIMGEVVSILTFVVVSVMSVLGLAVRNSALVLLIVANSCALAIVSSLLISLSLAVDAANCSLCKVLVAISFAKFLAMKAMDSSIDGGIGRCNESTIDRRSI